MFKITAWPKQGKFGINCPVKNVLAYSIQWGGKTSVHAIIFVIMLICSGFIKKKQLFQ